MAVVKVENVSKQYRLGTVGTGTVKDDLKRFWASIRGKEDPFLTVGEVNQREKKGVSDYVWALRDVSFEVEQGEVLGIVGKNGAGKSTLLKILSQVTHPTIGQIKAKGKIASLLEVGTGFNPELTGRENIFLNGAILGMSKQEIKNKFDEIVQFSGVEKFIDTPVKRYSSGMYVRLAFAVAAHLEPEILIIDEVLAVGDAEFQKKCLGKIKDVSKAGRTVLFVSHNLGMIRSLCTRAVLLDQGQVIFIGSASEVVDKYLEVTKKDKKEDCLIEVPEDESLDAQITKVKITDTEGKSKVDFDVFEQVVLEVEYILRKDYKALQLGLGVDRNGERHFNSFDTDTNVSLLDFRPKGRYKTITKFSSPLKSGSYTISALSLSTYPGNLIHRLGNFFNFYVDDLSFDPTHKSYKKERDSQMVAIMDWNTTFLK